MQITNREQHELMTQLDLKDGMDYIMHWGGLVL